MALNRLLTCRNSADWRPHTFKGRRRVFPSSKRAPRRRSVRMTTNRTRRTRPDMIRNTNDGTNRKPYLRTDVNAGTWTSLPDFSKGPRGSAEQILQTVKAAGFQGVQGADPT